MEYPTVREVVRDIEPGDPHRKQAFHMRQKLSRWEQQNKAAEEARRNWMLAPMHGQAGAGA